MPIVKRRGGMRMKGKAQSEWLAVKVLDGPAGTSKQDGVHLDIDGRHNREVIYNADDTHVFFSREEHKPSCSRTSRREASDEAGMRTQMRREQQ